MTKQYRRIRTMTSLLGSNQMERDPAFARRRAMTSIAGRDAQGDS